MWPFIVDLILGRGLMFRLVSLSIVVLLWLALWPERVEPPVADTDTVPVIEERE